MSIAKKRLSLSPAARDFLTAEFEAIGRSTLSSIRDRAGRVAVTFRTRRQGRDAIPDAPIPIEDLLLYALSCRRRARTGRGPNWRVILSVHAPALESPGSGRVAFRLLRAIDITDPRPLLRNGPNHTAMRAAVVLDQAARDADDRDVADGLRLPDFSFGFDPGQPERVDPIRIPAAEAARRFIRGLRARPVDLLVRDRGSILDRGLGCLSASLAGLKGRRLRNPAFAVLRSHGILPAGITYTDWRSTVSKLTGQGRIFQDPHSEATEASRLRRAIQDYVLAEPGRESRILADLAEACHAMGVRIAEGPEGVDALAGLLDAPWDRPAVPYAATVQVLRLAGPTLVLADEPDVVPAMSDRGLEDDRRRPAVSERG